MMHGQMNIKFVQLQLLMAYPFVQGLGTQVTVRNTRPVQRLKGSSPTTTQSQPDSHKVESLVIPIKYCKFIAAILN